MNGSCRLPHAPRSELVGKPRHRDAHIRDERCLVRVGGEAVPEGLFAFPPDLLRFRGICGELEGRWLVAFNDLRDGLHGRFKFLPTLARDLEKHRDVGQVGGAICIIEHVDHRPEAVNAAKTKSGSVYLLHAARPQTHLHCGARILDAEERAPKGSLESWDLVDPQGGFGDDSERALRADHQARQIVSRRALLGPWGGLHDASVGHHDRETNHVLPHGPVAHRGAAAAPARGHSPDGRAGARIEREPQAFRLQDFVQLQVADAGLHRDVEVPLGEPQDLRHPSKVQTHATPWGQQLALDGGGSAIRRDRHLVISAESHDGRDLLRRARTHRHVG
eukprot:scaffold7595_cov267-Pinguiococcus_pyrenoidosus.AAC.2